MPLARAATQQLLLLIKLNIMTGAGTPETRLAQLANIAAHPLVSKTTSVADTAHPAIIAGDMNTIGGQFVLRLSPIHCLTVSQA